MILKICLNHRDLTSSHKWAPSTTMSHQYISTSYLKMFYGYCPIILWCQTKHVEGVLRLGFFRVLPPRLIVLGKVRHSQRMNDPFVTLWIITEENGTVLFAHWVGCMAGQGERWLRASSSTLKHGIVWTKSCHVHRWNVAGWCQRPSEKFPTHPFQILILDRQRN